MTLLLTHTACLDHVTPPGHPERPDRLRAVVVPWPGITDSELALLTEAGVVGYRITHRLEKTIDQGMVARTHEHGWSMHYLVKSEEQADWCKAILPTRCGISSRFAVSR